MISPPFPSAPGTIPNGTSSAIGHSRIATGSTSGERTRNSCGGTLANDFDEIRPDEYAVAEEAAAIGAELVDTIEDHAHLTDARIAYLFRDEEILRSGRVVYASCHLGDFSGSSALRTWGRFIRWAVIRLAGFDPDFVILIDRNLWDGLSEPERRALIDHELCHAAQQIDPETGMAMFTKFGEPKWRIRPHDVEEFHAIVQRHGPWNADLAAFIRLGIEHLTHE